MFCNRQKLARSFHHSMVVALCVLAIAFALEAKTAWYGPIVGPGSAVRFAKALPIDAPRVIRHGIPTPDPLHPQFAAALVALLFALPILGDSLPGRANSLALGRVSAARFFSPPAFFRPPPAY
jgi:hypothetical protein